MIKMSTTIVNKCLTDVCWNFFYISQKRFKVLTNFRIFFKRSISICHVSCMVFVVVQSHCFSINVWFQSIVSIRKIRKDNSHSKGPLFIFSLFYRKMIELSKILLTKSWKAPFFSGLTLFLKVLNQINNLYLKFLFLSGSLSQPES